VITPAQQRRIKKMKLRYAKYQKKLQQYKRKLKLAGTERKKASVTRRIKKLGLRMDKLVKKMRGYVARESKKATTIVRPKAKKRTAPKKTVTKAAPKKKSTSTVPPHIKKDLDARTLKVSDIPQEMYDRIHRAAHKTFNAIGGDLMRAVEEDGGHAMKQDEVIESVFDANYMQIYGGDKEAEEYTHKLSWDELTKLGKKIFPYKSYN
jgi:hypothetical protein